MHPAVGRERAEQLAMEVNSQYIEQGQVVRRPAYEAAQQLFWENRWNHQPAAAASSTTTPPTTELFQPVVLSPDNAIMATASVMGVNVNDQADMQQWLNSQITTRQQVLHTIQSYHHAVIRPELYNMINQVEMTLLHFDDRLLRQHKEISWLASDNRLEQKRQSGLTVLLTGFPQTATPQDRNYMVNWMLHEVEALRHFLRQRGHDPEDAGATYPMFHILSTDPATPPAGKDKWSTLTLIHFRAWEARKNFMDHYGGSAGVPFYSDGWTAVRGSHIRATPASPQFQRKLEIPLRVILRALNLAEPTKNQVVILWKTLTIMEPQEQRAFDDQAQAIARVHYATEGGYLRGTLEVNPYLWDLLQTTPPDHLMADESSIWDHAWNAVVFGVQHEMDVAERDLYRQAAQAAKGTGKGMKVEAVAYVWDEYCDKFSMADRKCGDYKAATYQGAPALPTPTATTPAAALERQGPWVEQCTFGKELVEPTFFELPVPEQLAQGYYSVAQGIAFLHGYC
ncbi:unnamed protein product [Symbiodinium natans]|uniref:Uncharacterized protein n=1 Tax=Symbiodinium natans TaxID=878477 RepID=A0A812KAL7_9DINO|nr:unnamed protein product [Symbiodinium natans]